MNATLSEWPALHGERQGSGPLLIMLHGLFGSLDNFGALARRLEKHFTVLRLDLPGHGRSNSLPELNLDTLANAVLGTLAADGIERCHLLGHSLGGKVAMRMAAAPDQLTIDQLLIVDIAPKLYPPHHQGILDALQAIDRSTLEKRSDADAALEPSVPEAGVRAFLLKSLYRDDAGEWQWRFDLDGLQRDYAQLGRAPTIDAPVEISALFIQGADSDFIETQDTGTIDELFPQSRLVSVPGAGHWPHAEQPAEFARLCLDFLLPSQPGQAGTDEAS